MKTIAIVNQKGGCGKTTSAVNLAGVYAKLGLRTLLVDLDPQSHCAAGLAIPEQSVQVSSAEFLAAPDPAALDQRKLLWRAASNLDLIASTVELAGLESARGALAQASEPQYCLAHALRSLAPRYDLCLVDCSPSIGLLTYNALAAADLVLIPVETAYFALHGSVRQVAMIRSLTRRLGSAPEFRLLATLHDPDSVLAQNTLADLHRRHAGLVCPIPVRYDARIREAASFGQPVIEYAPASTGAADYSGVAQWLAPIVLAAGAVTSEGVSQVAAQVARTPGPSLPSSGHLHPPTPDQHEPAPAHAPGSRAAELAERVRRLVARERSAPAEPPVADWLGVRAEPGAVVFRQPLAAGRELSIVGDFNGWCPGDHVLAPNPAVGARELRLPAPPGPLRYRIVVDGVWMPDPYNAPVDGSPDSTVLVPPLSHAPLPDAPEIIIPADALGPAFPSHAAVSRASPS